MNQLPEKLIFEVKNLSCFFVSFVVNSSFSRGSKVSEFSVVKETIEYENQRHRYTY